MKSLKLKILLTSFITFVSLIIVGCNNGAKVKVTFNPNGGTLLVDTMPDIKLDEIYELEINSGETLVNKLPSATKDGYSFDAFYYEDQTKYTNQAITADTTLTANYTLKEYKIIYQGLEGGTHSNPAKFDIEHPVSFTAATRPGYNFDGWYLESTYATKITSTANQFTDLVVYAKWNDGDTAPLIDITIVSTSTRLLIGDTLSLSINANPDVPAYKAVNWSTSDPTVASINNSGVVTALKLGEFEITATSSVDSTIKDTIALEVVEFLDSVGTIEISGPRLVRVGGSPVQLTATVYPSTASNAITWSSSDSTIASVSNTGLVTGHSAGSDPAGNPVVIRATSNTDPTKLCEYEMRVIDNIAFTVSFELNDDTFIPANNTNVYSGVLLTLEDPTRPAYTFDGWYSESTFLNPITSVPSQENLTGDVTLYAKWSYNYKYYLTGYACNFTNTCDTPTAEKSWADYVTITSSTFPASEREVRALYPKVVSGTWDTHTYITRNPINISLLGEAGDGIKVVDESTWFGLPGDANAIPTYAGRYTVEFNDTANKTLDTIKLIPYDLKVEVYDDNNVLVETIYNVSKNTTISKPSFTKTGYQIEYYLTPERNSALPINFSTYEFSSDSKIYAKATANTYTIVYDLNASDVTDTIANQQVTYDDPSDTFNNGSTITRPGYNFSSWNSLANGTGDEYTPGALIPNLTSTNNDTITLYARWSLQANADEVSVTVHLNGGTGTGFGSADFIYNFTDSDFNLTTLTQPGYTFKGFYLTADFTGSPISTITPATMQTDFHIYARFTYTVVLHGNNGLVSFGTETDELNKSITLNKGDELNQDALSAYSATNAKGLRFLGWFSDDDTLGTGALTSITHSGSETINLYAHYGFEVGDIANYTGAGLNEQSTNLPLITPDALTTAIKTGDIIDLSILGDTALGTLDFDISSGAYSVIIEYSVVGGSTSTDVRVDTKLAGWYDTAIHSMPYLEGSTSSTLVVTDDVVSFHFNNEWALTVTISDGLTNIGTIRVPKTFNDRRVILDVATIKSELNITGLDFNYVVSDGGNTLSWPDGVSYKHPDSTTPIDSITVYVLSQANIYAATWGNYQAVGNSLVLQDGGGNNLGNFTRVSTAGALYAIKKPVGLTDYRIQVTTTLSGVIAGNIQSNINSASNTTNLCLFDGNPLTAVFKNYIEEVIA